MPGRLGPGEFKIKILRVATSAVDLSGMLPIILFDNRCYLCVKFARAANFLARGRLTMVGHYSRLGGELRDAILGESALEMFWVINGRGAYGGRAALLPLAGSILSAGNARRARDYAADDCGDGCKTVRSAFLRSASLFTHSKRIPL